MTREELRSKMPHREPMLLVDDSTLLEDGSCVGHYTVRGDEFFLQGHFPDHPIVPGVMLCEMTVQSATPIILREIGSTEGKVSMLSGMRDVRFRNPVYPGDAVEFRCCLKRVMQSFYFIKGEAYVGDKLCMQGEFSIAVY